MIELGRCILFFVALATVKPEDFHKLSDDTQIIWHDHKPEFIFSQTERNIDGSNYVFSQAKRNRVGPNIFLSQTEREKDIPNYFLTQTERNKEIPNYFLSHSDQNIDGRNYVLSQTERNKENANFLLTNTERNLDGANYFLMNTERNKYPPNFVPTNTDGNPDGANYLLSHTERNKDVSNYLLSHTERNIVGPNYLLSHTERNVDGSKYFLSEAQQKSEGSYVLTEKDRNTEKVTKMPKLLEEIPLWTSKNTNTNLKFPKFLFNNNDGVQWVENSKNIQTKPKETIEKVPKSVKNQVFGNTKTLNGFKSNNEELQLIKPNPHKIIDIHKNVFVEKPKAEQDVIKNKIFSLARGTEQDLSGKVKIIEKTNAMYRNNNYYKLGYIVSYVNTTHNALADLVNHVERNKEHWDVLKILNAYVQIKKTKEFLTDMLAVLNYLQSRQSFAQSSPLHGDKKTQSIAWSYYDDQ